MGWSNKIGLGKEAYILREDAEVFDLPDGRYMIACPGCGDRWKQVALQRYYLCAACGYKWRSR